MAKGIQSVEPNIAELANGWLRKYKLDYKLEQKSLNEEIPTDDTDTGVPYIVQSMFNNMFSRNVNRQWLVDHGEAPVSGNRIVLGVTLPAVSYQPREFAASQVITALSDKLDPLYGNFVATAIGRQMYQFGYDRKPGLEIYKRMPIALLSKTGTPDYELMETFISAIQKLVIKDVVLYADREREATEEVIGRHS